MRAITLVIALALLTGCSRVEQPVTNAVRFVARMSCSCVFVTGRDLPACLADLPPEATWLRVQVDEAARRVRANALWLQGEARFEEGRGCQLEN
jgi:hypothetical protein